MREKYQKIERVVWHRQDLAKFAAAVFRRFTKNFGEGGWPDNNKDRFLQELDMYVAGDNRGSAVYPGSSFYFGMTEQFTSQFDTVTVYNHDEYRLVDSMFIPAEPINKVYMFARQRKSHEDSSAVRDIVDFFGGLRTEGYDFVDIVNFPQQPEVRAYVDPDRFRIGVSEHTVKVSPIIDLVRRYARRSL